MLCDVKRQDFEAWKELVGGQDLTLQRSWGSRRKVIVPLPDTNTGFILTFHPSFFPRRPDEGEWSAAWFNTDRDIKLLDPGRNKAELKRMAQALIALML